MAFEWFKSKSLIAQIIFILIILYAISTIISLVLAVTVFSSLSHRIFLNPYITLTYAIISFVLMAFISAYHLSTMIRRRKRKEDVPAAGY